MPLLQNLLHELIQDFSSFNYVKQVGDRKLVTQFVKWFDPMQEISMILYHAPKGIYIGFREAMTSIVITFDERILKEPVMYDGKVVKSCELDVLTFKMKIHAIVTTQGKEEVITYELKPDEEKRLWAEMKNDNSFAARQELIERYQPLVCKIVGKLRPHEQVYLDLFQEGVVGLVEAVERFEPERGFKFSTYATFRIRGRALTYLQKASRHTQQMPEMDKMALLTAGKEKLLKEYIQKENELPNCLKLLLEK